MPALKVDTRFSKATRCAHGTGAWKAMHLPALRVHGTQMCIPQLSHSVSCEVWDCPEGMKRRVPFLAQAGEGHGNMLAARSIAFAAVSASAVSARELAIAPAPSKAAHARNEPLGWCARRTCRARASEPTMLMTLPRAVRRRAIERSRGTAAAGSERGTQMGCALPALLRHACSIAREGCRVWFAPFCLDRPTRPREPSRELGKGVLINF